MGWWLTAAEELPAVQPDHSVTTALIAALGAVLVALVTIGVPLLFRQSRSVDSPPLGETVAVLASREVDDRLTLATLDRHVDAIGDQVDKLTWRLDDLTAWRDEHRRKHNEQ